jgi:hypothetical protein
MAPAQVLTANRLIDGEVVYWRAGGWVEAFGEAEIFAGEAEAKAALDRAQHSVAANTVVGPYLFDLRADGAPAKEREIIRAMGPSVRTDLGKQADGPPSGFALRATPDKPALERDDDVSI